MRFFFYVIGVIVFIMVGSEIIFRCRKYISRIFAKYITYEDTTYEDYIFRTRWRTYALCIALFVVLLIAVLFLPPNLELLVIGITFLSIILLEAFIMYKAGALNRRTSFRRFPVKHISRLDIKLSDCRVFTVEQSKEVNTFNRILSRSRLTTRLRTNGLFDLKKMLLKIYASNGIFLCEVFVPPGVQDNLILKFKSETGDIWFHMPGLRRWIDENIINDKK